MARLRFDSGAPPLSSYCQMPLSNYYQGVSR